MDAMWNEILDFEDSAPFAGSLNAVASYILQAL
jgi:hypothetical protein